MSASVLLPYAGQDGHREAAWVFVHTRYATAHPELELVSGVCADAWVKAEAVANALARASGDVLVIADADSWVSRAALGTAIEAVESGAIPWAMPHLRVRRLDERSSALVIAGEQAEVTARLARPEYEGYRGGGIVVLPRADYERVPLDPRFVEWGGEDESWGLALTSLLGEPLRVNSPLWHLWHPHASGQPRPRRPTRAESRALLLKYRQAASEGTAAMAALVATIPPAGAA